jgi:hypothetical protein
MMLIASRLWGEPHGCPIPNLHQRATQNATDAAAIAAATNGTSSYANESGAGCSGAQASLPTTRQTLIYSVAM